MWWSKLAEKKVGREKHDARCNELKRMKIEEKTKKKVTRMMMACNESPFSSESSCASESDYRNVVSKWRSSCGGLQMYSEEQRYKCHGTH